MGFTPGPWFVGDEDAGMDEVEYIDIHAGDYGTGGYRSIAHAQPNFAEDFLTIGDEDRANARLIAAAPELLATLERIADGDLQAGSIDGPEAHVSAVVSMARDAIAKARGEARTQDNGSL